MNNRNIAVTIECFIKKNNKYLMLHRGKHKKIMPDVFMAPGGHIEFNEGLFEATRREVLEETGLTIKNLKVKVVGTAFLEDLNQEFFFHFVMADYASGKLKFSENDGEMMWLTPEEIAKLPTLLAEIKKIHPYLFDGTDKVISYKATYKQGNEMTNFILENPQ
jgi:8-oxo-dGTP diphosphatase